jgi:cell division protease FtsH
VRELFDLANENLPCIIFIDELDAVAKKRSGSGEGADSERDQTLNQLLVSMDGFNKKSGLLVVGATNRLDIIDQALVRPGRFDKIITVPNPDKDTREAIIKIHSVKKPLDVNVTELVKLTTGFNGAQVENIINEAVLYGIRNNSLPIKIDTFELVRDRVLFGQTTKKRELSISAQRRIAIHEIGHLLMGLTSKYVEKVEKVTIDSLSGTSLGYTLFESSDIDEGLYMREYLEDKLKVLLGGRVAEEIIFGLSVSSGAVSDLEQAFGMAKAMIMNYGMGDKIIYPYFSEQYKKEIDDEIHILINRAYKDTKQILESNKVLLVKLSNQLFKRRTLTHTEICNIILEAGVQGNNKISAQETP